MWGQGFSRLLNLTIQNTSVYGSLPPEWSSSTAFQQLQQLTIQDCNLTVILPSSWGSSFAFPQLQQLTVTNHGGQSTQSPSAYSNSTLMVQSQSLCPPDTLHSGSNITNSMPCGLWPNLQGLQLSRSSLIGSLPANFTDSFPQLQQLDTGMNQLTGPLPPTLPPHMTYLDLGGNNFSGSLPSVWSHNNLTLLTVMVNNLTGTIPSIWAKFATLVPGCQQLGGTSAKAAISVDCCAHK